MKTDQKEIFENMPVASALRVMVVPSVISQLIVLIYNMADTFYVGQTDNPYMVAATALILPVFNITLCLAGLAGIGGGALISRLLGGGQEEEASRVSAFSIWLGILIAAAFSLEWGSLWIRSSAFLEPGRTRMYSKAVCLLRDRGRRGSNRPVQCALQPDPEHREIREAGAGIVLGGVLNIILDPVFMFVLLPDGLEVLGAGIATCLSNCVACLFFLIVLFRMGKSSVITFSLRRGSPVRSSILAVFGVGVPSAIATFLFDLDYVIIDKLMVSYHDLALAAVGIVLKVERFPLNVGIGICQGMLPLVAYNYASGNRERMHGTIRLARRTGLVIAAVSILAYEVLHHSWPAFLSRIRRLWNWPPDSCASACWLHRSCS